MVHGGNSNERTEHNFLYFFLLFFWYLFIVIVDVAERWRWCGGGGGIDTTMSPEIVDLQCTGEVNGTRQQQQQQK